MYLCVDRCKLMHSSDAVVAMVVKGTLYCLSVKTYDEHICELCGYSSQFRCIRVCVQVWVCFCTHLFLLELVGSKVFWINAPKDESRTEQDLASGAGSLQGCLKSPFAGRCYLAESKKH